MPTQPYQIYLDYHLQQPIHIGAQPKTIICVGTVLCIPEKKHCHFHMLNRRLFAQMPKQPCHQYIPKLSDEDKQTIFLLQSNISNWIKLKRLPIKSMARPWDKRFWNGMRKLIGERLRISDLSNVYLNGNDSAAKTAEQTFYQQLGLLFFDE